MILVGCSIWICLKLVTAGTLIENYIKGAFREINIALQEINIANWFEGINIF